MYINSAHYDVPNMKNAESGRLFHSQDLELTEKKLKANDTKHSKAYGLCMLDNYVYRYKLRLCNSYCLSSS
jgi:hypothetical protein